MLTDRLFCSLAFSLLLVSLARPAGKPAVLAWGPEGHEMVNAIAVATLPSDLPKFMTDARLLSPKSPTSVLNLIAGALPMEPELNAAQAPEHFIDLEYAEMIGALPHKTL